jgi:cell wall-associated NlpC family hydrolase
MPAIHRMPSPARLPIDLRQPFARALGMLLALAIALAASIALSAAPADAAGKRAKRIVHAKNVALGQLGDRYVYGAAGPGAFDCSGLVYYSYRRAGIGKIPRTSSTQARAARHITKGKLRKGDLMFFYSGYGVYHVGMFLKWKNGHAVMVHSPRPGQRVQRAAPWTSSWFAGTFRGKKKR